MHTPNRISRLVAALLAVALLVVACAGPTGSGPPQPEPVIYETTEVVGAETREALVAYEEDGTLRFDRETAQLAAIRPDDVVVSEPTGAAPAGFLRRVVAVQRTGGAVALVTEHAALDEAVEAGALSASIRLRPQDAVSARALVPGVRVRSLAEPAQEGYDFEISFREAFVDLDGDAATTDDQIAMEGEIRFNFAANVDVNINWRGQPKKFEASLEIDQASDVHWRAEAALSGSKEIEVARFDFGPQTFFIGPVPVVLTEHVVLEVGVEGEIGARVLLTVDQEATMRVGARWRKGDGWENISGATFDHGGEIPDFDGEQLAAEARLGPEASVLFYGVVGPKAYANAFVRTEMEYGRDPFWTLSTGIDAGVGMEVDLPIIGELVSVDMQVLDLEENLFQAPNQPPEIRIVEPDAGAELTLNRRNQLIAEARDPEDDLPAVGWASNVDGELGDGVVVAPLFDTAGPRVLEATATDSRGRTARASTTVDVVNSPPDPTLSVPDEVVPATAQLLMIGAATDANDPNADGLPTGTGVVACERIAWTVEAPDAVSAASGCQVGVTFAEEGDRTVTLTATDIHGASTSLTETVRVGPAPADPPPVIESVAVTRNDGTAVQPGDGITANLASHVPLTLSSSASDPDGDSLDYLWEASSEGGPYMAVGAASGVVWDPNDTFEAPFPTAGPLDIRITVSDGTTPIRSADFEISWGRAVE